ncbi:MAG: RNA repair transcriptional activator RtcR [Myxococcota bacterium]
MDRPLVCIGLVGSTLDAGSGQDRWSRWRPTVSLFQHPDLLIDRLELLHQRRATKTTQQVLEDIERLAPETELHTRVLELGDPWDFEEVYAALHAFARGYPFDPEEEDYVVHITTGTHVAQICMFLLTESRHFPARLLQSSPPGRKKDPPGTYRMIDLDLSKYDQLFARFEQEQREGVSFLKAGIETRNGPFNQLIEQIERVAIASREPILLGGPTGAGKTMLARRIFELKRVRRQVSGRFVEVNCATLRGDAAMSTLFGHVKGAFTGALKDRDGLLKAADGGILFLDEIGELGLDEQAMLLRAIEEGRFMPMGADGEVGSEFQLIAGTNRDLLERVSCGEFREDLLARIDLWTFELPGLKDRLEDIEPNIDYELDKYAERTGERVQMNKEARQAYVSFATHPGAAWRGNFRDLNASVTRMATLATGGRIGRDIVGQELGRLERSWRRAADGRGPAEEFARELMGDHAFEDLDRFDRTQLADVLSVCRRARSLSEAGRSLFAESRKRKRSRNDADRLRKYLARYDLDFEMIHRHDD